jgi:hypothetical protein
MLQSVPDSEEAMRGVRLTSGFEKAPLLFDSLWCDDAPASCPKAIGDM